jgi:hypothetical protein
VLVAYDTDQLPARCAELKSFHPAIRTPNLPGLVSRLKAFIHAS